MHYNSLTLGFIADLPNWVGIGIVIALCGSVMVLSQIYVLARVVTRIEDSNAKQRAAFTSLWEIANDDKLAEHSEKLGQLWEDYHGSPPPDRPIGPQAPPMNTRVPRRTRWRFRRN